LILLFSIGIDFIEHQGHCSLTKCSPAPLFSIQTKTRTDPKTTPKIRRTSIPSPKIKKKEIHQEPGGWRGFLGIMGLEADTYDHLDSRKLVPYQCVMRRSDWEMAKPRFLEAAWLGRKCLR